MSTSTQPEGTEASPSENTSGQSHDGDKMAMPDKYQIVAVAPVEFFTTKNLDDARNEYFKQSNEIHVQKNSNDESRVKDLERHIKAFSNFDLKIYTDQINIEKIKYSEDHNSDFIELDELATKITALIEEGMNKKKSFENILGGELIEKAEDYLKELLDEDDKQFNQLLDSIKDTASDMKDMLRDRMKYHTKKGFWSKLKQELEASVPEDDEVANARINLLIANAKANMEAKKPISEIFVCIFKVPRDFAGMHKVLQDSAEELYKFATYDVEDSFWDELKRKLNDFVPENDKVADARINLLIADAKANIEAKKPIDRIFEVVREFQDLPSVRSVLRDAERELHEHATYDVEDSFWDELKRKLNDFVPENDKVADARINLLIADAKANIEAKKPIDRIFEVVREFQDLPSVRSVLRDAERELHEHATYDVEDSFWDKLKQNLKASVPQEDEVATARINLLIADAKANIEAKKPIDKLYRYRYQISRYLPNASTVLRDAERELHEHATYDVKDSFWDELKQNLKASVPQEDEVATARINLLIADAKANIEAKKPIDKLYRYRYQISRYLPNASTVLRDAERELHEHATYDVKDSFWDELKQNLISIIPKKDKNSLAKIEKIIVEAKTNIAAKKPLNETFRTSYRVFWNLPKAQTILRKFQKNISVSHYNDRKNFIKIFSNQLREAFWDNSKNTNTNNIYNYTNNMLEQFEECLSLFEEKLNKIYFGDQIILYNEKDILEEINGLTIDDSVEDNINKINNIVENLLDYNQNSDFHEENDSAKILDKIQVDLIRGNLYIKLNELYNLSPNNTDSKDDFLSKLSKFLLVEKILEYSESNVKIVHIKGIDILVAVPRKNYGDNIEEKEMKTGIAILLIIDVDPFVFSADQEESNIIYPKNVQIEKLFSETKDVEIILDLIYNKFCPNYNSESKNFESVEIDKFFANMSKINYSSILHIASFPNFELNIDNANDGDIFLNDDINNLIKKIIPEYSIEQISKDNLALNCITRVNSKGKFHSFLVSYPNRLLAIINSEDSFKENKDRVIGLQIVYQSFFQRLSQFNNALRSIATDKNCKSITTKSDRFNEQLHHTYTIPDELINLYKQDLDIAVLRKLLTSTTISNQIEIFKERRKTFFGIKENFENQQREEKVDKANTRIQLGIFVLAFITALYNFDISNYGRIYMSLVIILLFIVIYVIQKLDITKKFCFYVRSKIFSRQVMSKKFIASQLSPRLLLRKIKKKLRRIF